MTRPPNYTTHPVMRFSRLDELSDQWSCASETGVRIRWAVTLVTKLSRQYVVAVHGAVAYALPAPGMGCGTAGPVGADGGHNVRRHIAVAGTLDVLKVA